MRKLVPLLIITAFLVMPGSWGWAKGEKGIKKEEPITVTSQKMEAHAQKGWILFTGAVKAVKGDLTLFADRLKVFIAAKENAKSHRGKVDRILAKGRVKVEKGDRVILSEEAEYRMKDDVVEFTGHPKAWEGKNLVLGEKMLYYPKEDRSVVVGGKGRVNAVIYPQGEMKSEIKGPGSGKKLRK
jgi:lipopolysaccharide export system protein LptA